MVADVSTNSALLSKSYNEAYEIIERIASDNYQWPTNRAISGRRVVGIHELNALTSLASQVSSISSMLKKILLLMGLIVLQHNHQINLKI